jgi:hypothetical protein
LTQYKGSKRHSATSDDTTVFLPGDQGITIHKEGILTIPASEPPVLRGCKANGEKLWTVLTQDTNNTSKEISNAYSLPSIEQIVKYLHAAAGYPPEETWIKAIQAGNNNTWPTITGTYVHTQFPESNETQKGHMKRERQGTRSTKKLATIIGEEEEEPIPELGTHMQTPKNTTNQTNPITPKQPKAKKMKDIYIKIHNASDIMNTDQSGRFPATSSAGNKYIMTLVEVDGNYIDAEPMKDRSAGSMIKAYLALWNCLTATEVIKPTTHLLDKEASAELKAEIKKNCTIQLVPPDNHR